MGLFPVVHRLFIGMKMVNERQCFFLVKSNLKKCVGLVIATVHQFPQVSSKNLSAPVRQVASTKIDRLTPLYSNTAIDTLRLV